MKSKICGISDVSTLTYLVNHPNAPQYIGFIVNYSNAPQYIGFIVNYSTNLFDLE